MNRIWGEVIYFRKDRKRKDYYDENQMYTILAEKIVVPEYIDQRIQETYKKVRGQK